ncbi:MAG: alanine dehydrogenase [Planctomycetes bacterium]|nr:alanine dehydrogenase [Planctomycetota bacterium]
MKIGIPREIKKDEYRVAIVPAGVDLLTKLGHTVYIQKGAGEGSGIDDSDYKSAGAVILDDIGDVYAASSLIIKVKEPLAEEFKLITNRHILFTFFHFAASEELTNAMISSKCVCIAYETIEKVNGSLPILIPMSEVAGRMSIQEGAKYLERPMEGKGILLAGVPGVPPANVVIVGAGIVGTNAAKIAAGLGARVHILDINIERLRYLSDIMPQNVVTLYSNKYNLEAQLQRADLVILAVLIPGARAPKLIKREHLSLMEKGTCIVDVSIDQGGCSETSKPTTHSQPIFKVDNIIHYCVTNIPGAVGRTSTYALTNITLPYATDIAQKGWLKASKEDASLAKGLNIVNGEITYNEVAKAFDLPFARIS